MATAKSRRFKSGDFFAPCAEKYYSALTVWIGGTDIEQGLSSARKYAILGSEKQPKNPNLMEGNAEEGGTGMSINRASYDFWIAGKDAGKAVENPAWEEIKELILSLDGWNRTSVTFGNYDEGYYMAIGGGKDGKFIAYISYECVLLGTL